MNPVLLVALAPAVGGLAFALARALPRASGLGRVAAVAGACLALWMGGQVLGHGDGDRHDREVREDLLPDGWDVSELSARCDFAPDGSARCRSFGRLSPGG